MSAPEHSPHPVDVNNGTLHLGIPGLSELQTRLGNGPEVTSKVPVNNGSLQVGFRGKPESFGSLTVGAHDGILDITVDSARPIEGPTLVEDERGKKHIARAAFGPIGKITLKQDEDGRNWQATLFNGEGEVVDAHRDRVVVARVIAKLLDVTATKLDRQQRADDHRLNDAA